jgi:hypothetical protein
VGVVAAAFPVGARRLGDNSFFTHLATGRLITDHWHVPSTDPYTFTAKGTGWVVQSWLPSTAYALVEDLAGGAGLRVLMGALTAGIAGLVWRLTRPTTGILVRTAIAVLVVAIGASQWSSRPLLVGLIALAATLVAGEGGLAPRWLIPIGWLWVNSHGSFPLGAVYLACVVVGSRLDRSPVDVEVRCLRNLLIGFVVGAINPLGPRLLLFPLELLRRQDVLKYVVEWQAPGFQQFGQRLFLLQVVLTIVALVRRSSYRSGIVLAVFLIAALLGARNIAVASLAFTPIIAAAWTDVGGLRTDARPRLGRVAVLAMVAYFALAVVSATTGPHFDVSPYPVRILDYLDDHHVDLQSVRMGEPERVGNLLELRNGPRHEVFFDDRFDMFSDELNRQMVQLLGGQPGVVRILDEQRLDLFLWPTASPTTQIVADTDAWVRLREREGWSLLCRRGAELGPTLRCP